MAFKGIPRDVGAGRKKGVPNKKTQTLLDKCEELNFDPFAALIEMARESLDANIRLGALKEVCQYLFPKRKAIEHSGLENLGLVRAAEEMIDLTQEELVKIAQDEIKGLKQK